MKKRILSILLAFVMVVGLLPATALAAAGDNAIKLELVKDTTTFAGKEVLRMDFYAKSGTDTPKEQMVYLKFDASKLAPLYNADGSDVSSNLTSFSVDYGTSLSANNYKTTGFGGGDAEVVIYALVSGNNGYINWKVTEKGTPSPFGEYTRVSSIFFGLKGGTTFDAIPSDVISYSDPDVDVAVTSASCAAQIVVNGGGTGNVFKYKDKNGTDTMTVAPAVTAGEGVTIAKSAYSGAAATVTKVEKSGSNVVVTATVPAGETAQYGYSNENDASKVTNWQDSNSFAEPTTPGTYYFFARVKASDDHQAGGVSSGYAYTVYGPLSLSYPAPAAALTIGDDVSLTPTVGGGSGTYSSYAVTSGTLPGGLSIDTGTGVISGTLTTAGAASSVTVTVTDSVSNTQTATISFPAVEKKTNTVTFTAPKTEFVEGQTVSFTATATSGTPSYTYQKSGEAEWTTTVPTAVGSYTVKASVAESTDYKAGEATHEFQIIAKAVSSIAVTGPTKTTYVVGQMLDTAGMKVVVTYNDASTETINAGEFEEKGVTITGFDSAAPAASQTVTVTYGGKSDTFTVTIEARALISIEVTTPPSKTTGYVAFDTLDTTGMVVTATYNDGTEAISAANFAAKGVTISYSGDNTSFRAGETKATVNFGGKQADVTVATVGKATLDTSSVAWSGSTSVPYDGSSHSVVLTGLPTGVTVSSYQDNVKTYVGSYTAKANLSYDTANYELFDTIADCSWSINKVAQTLSSGNTSEETAFSLKKGSNSVDLTTLVSTNAVGNTLSFTLDAATYATLGADGKTLTSTDTTGTVKITVSAGAYNVDGSGEDEFDAATSIAIYVNVVNKDTDTETLSVSQASFTYGESTVNPVVSNKPETAGAVSFSYVGRNETSYSGLTPPTNAGDYTVTATCEDAGTIYTASADFSINRKSISGMTVTLSETSKEYNGGSQSVTVTSVGSLNPASDYEVVSGTSGSNADTYTVTVEGKGNYTGTASTNWRITPKAITISGATATDRDYVKDDKSVVISGVTFTGATLTKGTDYTVTGEMDDANAGTDKTVTVTVTLTNGNYSLEINTTTTTVTINQIDPTTPTGLTGLKDKALSTVTLPDGWTWDTPATTMSTLGDQTFKASYAGSTNYKAKSNVDVTVTVSNKAPAGVSISGAPTSKTYGDADFTLTASVANAGTGTGTWTWISSDPTVLQVTGSGATATVKVLKVGSATITAKYESDTTMGEQTTAAITVGKRVITVTADNKSMTVNGTLPTFTVTYGNLPSGVQAEDIFDTLASASTTADGKTTGSFDITVTTPVLKTEAGANYEVGAVTKGTLTVNPRSSSGGGGGGSAATPPASDKAAKELKNAKEGSTVTIDMKGETKLPASVTKEIAGKDVTVELDMGGGMVWSFSGLDVPKGGVSLDLGVKTGTKTIPAKVIHALTGETTTVQLQLSHNGPFGMSLKLSVDLGKKHDGLYANLYFYNPKSSALEFRSAGMISGGKASWAFDHASDYAIVIDKESHEPMTFIDVPDSAYYAEAVNWAVAKKITGGIGNGLFAPNDPCTRAQIVTFLWRAAGSPAPKNMSSFTDVPADAFYAKAVAWAVENGITNGTSATAFSPNATCSRAQIVTFLWRSQKSPAADTVNPFTDVAADSYYANAVVWAAENGITGGTSATTFSPSNNCTRAQIVTFLFRCLGE